MRVIGIWIKNVLKDDKNSSCSSTIESCGKHSPRIYSWVMREYGKQITVFNGLK